MTSEANHYQVYGKLSDKDNVIKASSNIPGVKFEISKIVEGRLSTCRTASAELPRTYNTLKV